MRPAGTAETRIALILTVKNEVAGIAKLLRSIDQQTLAPDEVVICDAGSTDGTLEMIDEWKTTTPVPATVVRVPGGALGPRVVRVLTPPARPRVRKAVPVIVVPLVPDDSVPVAVPAEGAAG